MVMGARGDGGSEAVGRRAPLRTLLVLAVVAALGLVSCSGDDGASDLSLTDIRDKLQDAGIECDGEPEEPEASDSDFGIEVSAQLECEVGDSTISMAEFPSKGDVTKALVIVEGFACGFGGEDVGFVTSGRWLLSVSETDTGTTDTELLGEVSKALGVDVKTIECDGSDSSSGSSDSSDSSDSSSSSSDFSDIALTSGDDPLAFGDTAEWEDGVTLTVSEPEAFTPGDTSSFDEEGGEAVAFEITLTNGSEENFDPGSVFPNLRSGTTEASEIYDYEQLGDRPSTTLLPGDEAVWKVAFNVSDPEDLVMEIQPTFGFEYADAIFATD